MGVCGTCLYSQDSGCWGREILEFEARFLQTSSRTTKGTWETLSQKQEQMKKMVCFICVDVLSSCVFVHCVCASCPRRPEEGTGSPKSGVTDGLKCHVGTVYQTWVLLQEQRVLITTESFLQSFDFVVLTSWLWYVNMHQRGSLLVRPICLLYFKVPLNLDRLYCIFIDELLYTFSGFFFPSLFTS